MERNLKCKTVSTGVKMIDYGQFVYPNRTYRGHGDSACKFITNYLKNYYNKRKDVIKNLFDSLSKKNN